MGKTLFFIILAGIIIVVIASMLLVKVMSRYLKKKRSKMMMQVAKKLNFIYQSGPSKYSCDDLRICYSGESSYSTNLIAGKKKGFSVELFDYQYILNSGKYRGAFYYSMCVLTVPQRFSSLYIRSEELSDKLYETISAGDIKFESKEFNSRYYVKANDRKFAYDIINPEMINFLLHYKMPPFIEINGGHLAFYYIGKVYPETFVGLCNMAEQFYNRIPHYVLKEYAKN